MWPLIKGALSWLGSISTWLLDRLYGDRIFAYVRPMIPEWLVDPSYDGLLDSIISFGPPVGLFLVGAYFFYRGRSQFAKKKGEPKIRVFIPEPPYHAKTYIEGNRRTRQEFFLNIQNTTDEGLRDCTIRVDATIPKERKTSEFATYRSPIAIDMFVREQTVFSLRGGEVETIVFITDDNRMLAIHGQGASANMMPEVNWVGLQYGTVVRIAALCDAAPPAYFFFRVSRSASGNIVVEEVHP